MAMDDDMQTFRRNVVTNGDKIRSMTDEQLARYLIPYVCAMHHVRDCQSDCDDCALQWLRKEAEP